MSISDNKCLASWSVFRAMNIDGKNAYDILREFIKATIYRNGLHTFTVPTLTARVNEDYMFNLKSAIVSQAIKPMNFATAGRLGYTCNPNDFEEEKVIIEKIDAATKESENLLEQLFSFVESSTSKTLSDDERGGIIKSFVDYILTNAYSDQYSSVISAFIIKYKSDPKYSVLLHNILEGVVKYSGINYDEPVSENSRWTTKMTIYLDTEILFHMAGYNGDIYKQIFDDFYSFVEEINTSKKLIYLRYFSESADEIDTFFDRAKDIVNGKMPRRPEITAMGAIVEGCTSEVDIDEKKGLLLDMIKQHQIQRDSNTQSYYDKSDYTYNIENLTFIKDFKKENPTVHEKDIINSLTSLSHINVLRKGLSKRKFENLEYILITDNSITKKITWMPEIKDPHAGSLSTDLYFITNRMWYRLGKSFGNSNTPKIFDVITKAQIILSNQINISVAEKYEELKKKLEDKEITTSQAQEVLYQLRSQTKYPEEIEEPQDADQALKELSETSISKYTEEAEFRKVKAEQAEKENRALKKANEEVHNKNAKIQQENEAIRKENDRIKDEKTQMEHERTKMASDLESRSKENNLLKSNLDNLSLKYSNQGKELHDLKEAQYIKEQVDRTKTQLYYYIGFVLVSVLCLSLIPAIKLPEDYPLWAKILIKSIQIIVETLAPVLIPIIRSEITKISIADIWKVLHKHDFTKIKENFEKSLSQIDSDAK